MAVFYHNLVVAMAGLCLINMCVAVEEPASVCLDSDIDLCFTNDLPCWEGSDRLPENLDTRFFLYTKHNNDPDELIYNNVPTLDVFDQKDQTIAIIHGFTSSSDNKYMTALRDEYLKEPNDVTVIMVDWEEAAAPNFNRGYNQCRQNTRLVGRQLGLLLQQLHNTQELDYETVHIIGHSLGAHAAGFAGEFLGGNVDRITGLDPAAPFFSNYRSYPGCLLDKTDANYVDIIHSDLGAHVFGIEEAIGDADFYPNKDRSQQYDCKWYNIVCSHMRALDFFRSSLMDVVGCDFQTSPCNPTFSCDADGCPKMGEMAGATRSVGEFCVDTSSCTAPYIE